MEENYVLKLKNKKYFGNKVLKRNLNKSGEIHALVGKTAPETTLMNILLACLLYIQEDTER